MIPNDLLTFKELAEATGYSIKTIYGWSSDGLLKKYGRGRNWKVSLSWFVNEFQNKERKPKDEMELDRKAAPYLLKLRSK